MIEGGEEDGLAFRVLVRILSVCTKDDATLGCYWSLSLLAQRLKHRIGPSRGNNIMTTNAQIYSQEAKKTSNT